jgi:hypothetical protein
MTRLQVQRGHPGGHTEFACVAAATVVFSVLGLTVANETSA